jgi:hypothetical protein
MVTGQLLRLSSAMSSGVLDIRLDIRHHFDCCIIHFFITLLLSIIQADPIFKCCSNIISCPISISDISNEKAFKGL